MLFHLGRSFVRANYIFIAWRSALAICAGLAFAASAQATDFVGAVQPAALAQPMINIALSTSDSGPLLTSTTIDFDLATGQIVEKTIFNLQAYLDTGASGILLSTTTASDFGVPLQTVGATQVTYQDVGAVGSATFNVSQPIFLRLSPTNPAIDPENPANYSQLPGSLRAQVGPVFDAQGDDLQRLINELLGGDINVVGTPAMAGTPAIPGKVVVVDLRATNTLAKNSPSLDPVLNSIITGLLSGDPTITAAAVTQLNQLEDGLTLRSYLYAPGTPFHNATPDTDPGIPATNRHIKLTLASFDRFTSVSPTGAPSPDLSANPFIGPNPISAIDGSVLPGDAPGVKIAYGGLATEGSFLLDTGAAASMISTNLAAQLHVRYHTNADGTRYLETFDPANPGSIGTQIADQFQLTIGGIGNDGSQALSGFYLDSLLLCTLEGDAGDDDDPNHLRFFQAPVLVNDITLTDSFGASFTLDGILGMNFLTASSTVNGSDFDLSFGELFSGQFDWMTVDFNSDNPVLGLQLSVEAVPEPSSGLLAVFGFLAGAAILRKKRKAFRG